MKKGAIHKKRLHFRCLLDTIKCFLLTTVVNNSPSSPQLSRANTTDKAKTRARALLDAPDAAAALRCPPS